MCLDDGFSVEMSCRPVLIVLLQCEDLAHCDAAEINGFLMEENEMDAVQARTADAFGVPEGDAQIFQSPTQVLGEAPAIPLPSVAYGVLEGHKPWTRRGNFPRIFGWPWKVEGSGQQTFEESLQSLRKSSSLGGKLWEAEGLVSRGGNVGRLFEESCKAFEPGEKALGDRRHWFRGEDLRRVFEGSWKVFEPGEKAFEGSSKGLGRSSKGLRRVLEGLRAWREGLRRVLEGLRV